MKNFNECRLLLVDDTRTNIDILVNGLKDLYKLSIAMDGETALNIVKAQRPDLILLDIMMPEIDGYEVCRILQEDPETSGIPIIFLTALDHAADKAAAFEQGAVDYITKPFEMIEVKARIKTHLSLKLSREEMVRMHEEEMLQAAKMISIGTLVAGMGHEINNPTAYILSNTYNLQRIWGDLGRILTDHRETLAECAIGNLTYEDLLETMPQLLTGIREGAERINRTVAGLKDFARKEKTDPDHYQPVYLNDVVDKGLTLMAGQIKKYTNNFRMDLGLDLPAVKGSFHQMEQVLINLLLNGAQALTDKGQALRLTTTYDLKKEEVRLTIIDEGEGMDQERQKRIFEHFFTTKTEDKGTGLGLAITAKIIKDHNSRIEVASTPGQGTMITVSFPALREEIRG
ncbi:MAG: response regulator [Proteobacteria bacterium]|nr:response regulator [Pseudomonadota bacterium]MBU1715099.1 response regulator [Pseudomonadota bacterium]